MSFKRKLRNGLAQALYWAGFTAPEKRSHGRFSIVTFHRVLRNVERQAYPYPGLAVTPEELDAYLVYFKQHFDCGALAAQHDRYLNGEVSARPLLAITFDDAQYDNYKNARPVLARHNLKASFFAPVEAVTKRKLLWHDQLGFSILALLNQGENGQARLRQILANAGLSLEGTHRMAERAVEAAKHIPLEVRLRLVQELAGASGASPEPDFARLMTFEEISELAADGHEIGSHSMTHCLMPECDDQSLRYELEESRSALQRHTGESIETFCYPNGNSDERSARAVSAAGYRRAVTTTWGSNDRNEDPFRLYRFNMDSRYVTDSNGKLIPAVLAFRMSGFYPGLG